MPNIKLSSLVFPLIFIASIPVILLIPIILFCCSIFLLTIILLEYIFDAIYFSESGLLATFLAVCIPDEPSLGGLTFTATNEFQRLNRRPYPLQISNIGLVPRPSRHFRRASTSSESGIYLEGRRHPLRPLPGFPHAAQSTQGFSAGHGVLGLTRSEEGGEWEDVNDDNPSERRHSEVLTYVAHSHDPRRLSSPSLRSSFFVGRYNGDVNGVLPTGPRLHFNIPPPRRRHSTGKKVAPFEIVEY